MGRTKLHKSHRQFAAPAFVVIGLNGPALALTWDTAADQALRSHPDELVIVCPTQGRARTLMLDLATETPLMGDCQIAVTDALQWHGSRLDHPHALLACIRYEDDTPACADAVRYRALMQTMGQTSII
ncbi:hypothetical protein [Streptomyces jumonjinensis]|uniref:hypothetical protein n=1 Tax=Streptomyces jumonjinensis TaxID=1945 RepID=UPI0037B3AD01